MDIKEGIKSLRGIIPEDRIREREPMRDHTTFRVGGEAAALVTLFTREEAVQAMACIRGLGIPCFILGRGSNLLVSDKGYEGIILTMGGELADIEVRGEEILTGAGAQLITVALQARDEGLTGLEFASGIPGSVGGAVFMNAGAYDGEMKNIISSATVLTPQGEIAELSAGELELSYRSSILKRDGGICLGAHLRLERGDRDSISARIKELGDLRRKKQPLEYPSAGSTFKRPEGHFAGKLIMEAGLAGERVGGACVSEKHCGFIVNTGGATASDIYRLMELVKDRVMESSGVRLEPEVCMIGEF